MVVAVSGEIKVETQDSHAIVTISRPDKLNSVTRDMLFTFKEKVSAISNEPKIRVIVFTGEGDRSFSAGFDLETVKSLKGEDAVDFFKTLERTIRDIRQNRTCVTIASVNGYAIGFGAMVSLACDFRLFSEKAIFALPEVDLSIFPGAGAASNLIHLVGPARAKEILMTGRKVAADEAQRIGLADMVFPHSELKDKTMVFVDSLLDKDQQILIRTKTLIDGMTGKDISDADDLEVAYLDEWLREK